MPRRLAAACLAATGAGCALLAAAPASRAAVFCAASVSEIVAAMDTAKANGEDDEIRIVAGNYPLDQPLRLGNVETEAFALAFSGRWNADCSEPSAGGASTLGGRNRNPIMYLSLGPAVDLSLTDLAFTGGLVSFNDSGGALHIQGGRLVRIERVQVYANTVENDDSPLTIATGGADSRLSLRNSLVFHNTARRETGVTVSSSSGEAYVTGNTITANESSVSCPCSALNYAGTSAWTVANNNVWGNQGGDVFVNPPNAIHLHNNIGVLAMGGNPPGAGSSGDLSVDPLFADDGVHLRPESPLVNAGFADAPGGLGDLDGGRGERLVGASVDIGAFETDVLFRDGFDGGTAP